MQRPAASQLNWAIPIAAVLVIFVPGCGDNSPGKTVADSLADGKDAGAEAAEAASPDSGGVAEGGVSRQDADVDASANGNTFETESLCAGFKFQKQDYASRTGFNFGDSWMMTWSGDGKTYVNFSDGELSPNSKQTNALLSIVDDPPNVTAASFAAIAVNPLHWEGSWAHYITNTIAIGETLYVAVVDIAGLGATRSSIARSDDSGRSLKWDRETPMWSSAKDKKPFMYPTFLQNGRGYAGNDDGFMYVYGSDGDWGGENRLRVARVKVRDDIQNVANYEYFTGQGWSREVADAADVLEDGRSLGGMESFLYNPVLRRYFLITFGEPESDKARMTVYDAPKPWGPWFRCGVIKRADALFTSDALFHALYNPSFNAKWVTESGDMWISYSNYTPVYSFHYGRITIETKALGVRASAAAPFVGDD